MPVFVGAGTSSFMKGSDGVGVSTMTTTERNALTGVKKGQFIFNETVNLAQYYDGTAWKSIDSPPSITNFTIDGGSSVTSAKVDRTAGGNSTIVIAGSNFDTTAGTVTFVPESGGATVNVQSIVRNSVNQFTVTVQRSDFIEANDPYTIRLANGSGLSASLAGAIDVNVPPVFAQSADTNLATIFNGGAALSGSTANASATDADGDTITYSITSGNTDSTFAIDADGVVTLNTGKSLSYASQSVWSLEITATSDGSKTDTAILTVNVSNETLTPVFDTSTSGTSVSVDENASPGSTIGLTVEANPASGDSATIASFDITASEDNGGTDSLGTFAIDPSSGDEVLDDDFKDHKFSVSGLAEFTSFEIKIVLRGSVSPYAPRLKDFRGIALAV